MLNRGILPRHYVRLHPDTALERFNELCKSELKQASEADTRAKLLDPNFIDILGWQEHEITSEAHVHSGFLDYTFRVGEVKQLIVEAKKSGHSCIIPCSFSIRRYKLNGTITTDQKIKAAIDQAQKYCVDSGVNFSVISNGRQFIIFEAFRRGESWRDSRCVVFRSLEDIKENFTLFWNILSREAVENGSLRKYVSEEKTPLNFIIPRNQMHARDALLPRNDLSQFLEPLLQYAFADLTDNSQLEVLESCYVQKREYQTAGLSIGRHFDRPPAFAKKYEVTPIVETQAGAGDFQGTYEKAVEYMQNSAYSGEMILLMGGMGVGKTTFIHHFFKFVIGPHRENALWFYANFLEASPNPESIEHHVYSSILRDFEIKYGNLMLEMKEELSRAGIGAPKPDIKDIMILFSLLTRKGYTLALVLDNADQHSYISEKYQDRALLLAKSITSSLRTITIVTLREESFFRSTMSGVLDAIVPSSVFHVAHPSFEDLIRSRIDYVLGLLEKPEDEIESKIKRSIKLGDKKKTLIAYFEILKDSLRSNRNMGRKILNFMNEISGDDMRQALDFFRTFLVSGNTNINEMMYQDTLNAAREPGKRYQIPFHHVIKSIMLEHSRLYSGSESKVMNLFDLNSAHTNSHFANLRILNYLEARMSYSTRHGRGFVEIDEVINKADEIDMTLETLNDSLKKMALYGLVEFENQSKKGYDEATYVRITNSGAYYVKELVRQFAYLDLVWMDTPVSDEKVVKILLDHVVERADYKLPSDIEDRFVRTETFLDYLGDAEDDEFAENAELSEATMGEPSFLPEIKEAYKRDRDYILRKRGMYYDEEDVVGEVLRNDS